MSTPADQPAPTHPHSQPVPGHHDAPKPIVSAASDHPSRHETTGMEGERERTTGLRGRKKRKNKK